jgi:hypothetical protein
MRHRSSHLRNALVDMDASGSLARNGYCLLPDAVAPGDVAAVAVEACALAMSARRVVGDYYCVNDDGSISSPRRLGTVAAGPLLQTIHRDARLLELLEHITARRLSPSRSSYIYYAPGDYIGLHKDASVCRITLITSITGALDPLVVHPSLIDVPPEQLVEISRTHAAMPPGGTRVAVPKAGIFLMLRGSTIPHHRSAALDTCTIATLCYG